jgi:hypothetical protein
MAQAQSQMMRHPIKKFPQSVNSSAIIFSWLHPQWSPIFFIALRKLSVKRGGYGTKFYTQQTSSSLTSPLDLKIRTYSARLS